MGRQWVRAWRLGVLAFGASFAACDGADGIGIGSDGGEDVGLVRDVPGDGGPSDIGQPDADARDAVRFDSGAADAGPDARPLDTGPSDAGGPADGGGPSDTGGPFDTGRPTDAAAPDGDAGGPACETDPFVDRTVATARDDELRGVIAVGDGVVTWGYEGGTLGVARIEPGGDATGLVSWRDGTGAETRRIEFRTDGSDVVEAVAPRATGLVAVGRTSGALAGPNAGQFDTFVALLGDGAATPVVAQSGTERPQHPTRAVVRGDHLFVAGHDDLYIPSNFVEAWEDAAVERWRVAVGPPANDYRTLFGTEPADLLFGLAVSPEEDGPVFVSGAVQSGAQAGPFARATSAADGGELWRVRIAPFGLDNAAAVLAEPAGTLLVVGSSHRAFGTPGGGQDVFVLRLAAEEGTILASTSVGSADTDWVADAVLDAAGDLHVVGVTWGGLAGDEPARDGTDMFALRFDAALAVTGRWQSRRAGLDAATGVAVDACGRPVAAGYVDDLAAGGTGLGDRDGLLVRIAYEPHEPD